MFDKTKGKLNSGIKCLIQVSKTNSIVGYWDLPLTDSKNALIIEPSYLDNTSFDLFYSSCLATYMYEVSLKST